MRTSGLALLLLGCAPAFHGLPAPRPFDPAERSAWLEPARWGLDGELGPDIDRVELGPRTIYLAFEVVPAAARALLVITPLDRGEAVLIVERVTDGAELARVPIDGSRPIWLELPLAARHDIAVRAEGSLAVATPLHADRRARPRVELVIGTRSISTAAAR